MSDSKYFTTTKKGEIYELKAELNSEKKEKKKEAVKKVIASMTVGKDVSALFPDVINCMQTGDLELKKLVYLYLMNYAKSQPDMAIMAVNTFVKDCVDPNPLIRALAVRTMGCIRVDKITEYLCEPLRKCLKDDDPYVRKTAAVSVAKLYDINAQLVEDQGFVDALRDLLSDSNPMVVANAVAALAEINDASEKGNLFEINTSILNKLLTALNECTEWGQIFILDSLALYTPREGREAQSILERITPRLQHANAAVVLSAVKVLMKYLPLVEDKGFVDVIVGQKLAPPLVTLLSSEQPEVQYVALRNINLIVQKRPDVLKHEIKQFFVKYNDPIYVKLEKLDVMIRLAAEHNIQQVLAELKEYSTEVDVDFVRKSVRSIGRCAIKIESAAQRCIDTLLQLIQTKVNYVVQEAIVVIKDIFRKYPNQYESIIATLCENLDTLDEPEAKASMIWIIGEYADRIDNADELLEQFLENFADENTQVQLQLLTATVKLFLKKPAGTQELVQKVLTLATQDSDNPDLRDRGYIYWRLLSADAAAAKAVVLSDKPLISDETDTLEPSLLDELISNISTLASVYHKPPSTFVAGKAPGRRSLAVAPEPQVDEDDQGPLDSSVPEGAVPYGASYGAAPVGSAPAGGNLIDDLLGLDIGAPAPTAPMGGMGGYGAAAPMGGVPAFGAPGGYAAAAPPARPPPPATSAAFDLLADLGGAPASTTDMYGGAPSSFVPAKAMWLPASKGKGLEITGTFSRRQRTIFMELSLTNRAMQPMGGFAVQFNKNSFGLAPAQPLQVQPLPPNQSVNVSLPLNNLGAVQKMDPLLNLQVAIKNNIDIFYFSTLVPSHVLFVEEGRMERQMYLQAWGEIPDANEKQAVIDGIPLGTDAIEARLEANNIFTVAKRNVDGQDIVYSSVKFTNGIWVLLETTVRPGGGAVKIAAKTRSLDVIDPVQQLVGFILRQ
eukprot:Colp12_sorted_trinity150504_noHs@17712